MATAIEVSASYLSSIFKQYAGKGFNDYVNFSKIELAFQLLSTGEHKVYEVSELLGFDNSYYFSTVYKRITGISPSETHVLLREGIHDASFPF